MQKFLLYESGTPDKSVAAPFSVLFGTVAPDDGDGANGDYYFRFHNGTENIYKKSGGTWAAIGGGTGGGFDTQEEFVTGSPKTIFNITVAAFDANTVIDVLLNGQDIGEYTGGGAIPDFRWKRDVGGQNIELGEALPVNGRFKARLYS